MKVGRSTIGEYLIQGRKMTAFHKDCHNLHWVGCYYFLKGYLLPFNAKNHVPPSFHLICLSVCLSVYLSVCLSICLSVCLSVYLSVCLLLSYRCQVADGTRHYGGRGQAYDWQITQVLHTQPKPEARVHPSIKEFCNNNKNKCLHKQILQNTSVPTSKLTH